MESGTHLDQPDNTDREVFVDTFQRVQLCAREERYADARVILLSAVERWPRISVLWGFLGCVSEERGLGDEALDCLRKSRDLKPDREDVSLALIDLLWNHGYHSELVDEVVRYLSIRDSEEHRNWAGNLTDYLNNSVNSTDMIAYAISRFTDLNLKIGENDK